ncbi:hypothetical protein [Parasphingopyxis lamellibrachiae]|nr:hypothetical protein [Parasphingopyxis lamellibrachiae]
MVNAKPAIIVSALILAVAPNTAFADTRESEDAGAVHRLSPEEMAEITASSAEPRIDAEALLENDSDAESTGRIQSVIGFGIGTNGYRELSASTLIPIGKEGFLSLGFGHFEDNLQRRYRYRRGYHF